MKLNKKLALLLLSACVSITTGCVSSRQYEVKYDENKSLALNIVNNSNINQYSKIKDTKVPVGVKKHLANTTEYGALNTATKFSFPVGGVSGFAAGGLGVLEMLTAAKEHSEQTHLLAWIPADSVSSADEAQQVLFNQSRDAVKKTISALGLVIEAERVIEKKKYLIYAASFSGVHGCEAESGKWCALTVRIAKPKKFLYDMPKQITGTRNSFYGFTPAGVHDLNSSVFVRVGDQFVKHPELLKALADNLPALTAVYVPPKTSRETIGTEFPYILKDGKYELFLMQ